MVQPQDADLLADPVRLLIVLAPHSPESNASQLCSRTCGGGPSRCLQEACFVLSECMTPLQRCERTSPVAHAGRWSGGASASNFSVIFCLAASEFQPGFAQLASRNVIRLPCLQVYAAVSGRTYRIRSGALTQAREGIKRSSRRLRAGPVHHTAKKPERRMDQARHTVRGAKNGWRLAGSSHTNRLQLFNTRSCISRTLSSTFVSAHCRPHSLRKPCAAVV